MLVFPSTSAAWSYFGSIAVLLSIYYFFAHVYSLHHETAHEASEGNESVRAKRVRRKAKTRSWIITATSSAVMTVGSVPFVWDLVCALGDVAMVRRREWLSEGLTSFFLAYLLVDCFLGLLHYRSEFNVLTGWVHHSAYTLLLFYVLQERFAHIFALAAVMELPTFVLSLSVLVPATRSDLVFSSLFFLTRIFLHGILIGLYITPYGRLYGTSTFTSTGHPVGSLVPVLGLLAASPLHVSWFHASLQGMFRRRKAFLLECSVYSLSTTSTSPSTPDNQLPLDPLTASPPSPLLLPARPRLVSLASSYLASSRPLLFSQALMPRHPFRRPTGEATYEALLVSAERFRMRLRDARARGLEIISNNRPVMGMGKMGKIEIPTADEFRAGVMRMFEEINEKESLPREETPPPISTTTTQGQERRNSSRLRSRRGQGQGRTTNLAATTPVY